MDRIKFREKDVHLPLQWNKELGFYTEAEFPELDRAETSVGQNFFELEDLLPMYPDQNIKNIQTYISSKYEFKDKSSLIDEPYPQKGEFFRSQHFFHRYAIRYPRIFNMKKPGTGKTGDAGGLAEKIRHNLKLNQTLDYVDTFMNPYRSNIKQVVILVANKILKYGFKNEIIYRYSKPGDYDITTLNNKDNLSSKNKFINRLLKGFYQIETYSKFAKKIIELGYTNNMTSYKRIEIENAIKAKYSDTLFITDEAHNIRFDTSSVSKVEQTKYRSKAITYDIIDMVFHTVDRSHIILMSATPMINDASENIDLFNLILPVGQQFMSNSKEDRDDFKNLTVDELEPYYRGKISYVSESGSNINKKYIGDKILNGKEPYIYVINDKKYVTSQIIDSGNMITELQTVDGTYLPCQGRVYLDNIGNTNIINQNLSINDISEEINMEEIFEDTPDDIDIDVTDKEPKVYGTNTGNFFKEAGKLRQICAGIFPDGSYGKAGFSKYIVKSSITGDYEATPELLEAISNLDYLKALSINYWKIITRLIDDYKDETGKAKGPKYGYTHLKEGSGAIYLGLCMEANGFEKFRGDASVIIKNRKQADPLCTPTMEERFCSPEELKNISKDQYIDSRFTKKPRYAILTSNLNDTQINNIMALYSSPENIDGEYLKFLIITPIGKEGISLANSMKFFLIDPSWNPSSKFQAESRGFRETSHDIKTQLYRTLTGNPNAKLDIEIYNMCATLLGISTVHQQLYILTEMKDIEIKLQERNMKIVSVDNYINRERNQKIIDPNKEFTNDCDYSTCKYPTYDPIYSDYIDYTTYDLLYSDDVINDIIKKVANIFQTIVISSLSGILGVLREYRSKLVIFALNKIINQKIKLINRYGHDCYLLEDQGIFYTQNEFPVGVSKQYNLNYYNSNLISVDNKKIEEYISDKQNTAQQKIINSITSDITKSSPESIDKMISELSLNNKIDLFEKVMIGEYIKGITTEIGEYIIKKYSESWMEIKNPINDIIEASKSLSSISNKRPGRKAKEVVSSIPNNSPEKNSIINGETVYIHILHGDLDIKSAIASRSNFNKAEGLIRVLKIHEDNWRDANEAESIVYRKFFVEKRSVTLDQFERGGIYGTLLADNKFRIVNIEPGAAKQSDGRKNIKGQVAATMTKSTLAIIMYKLNIELRGNEYDMYNIKINNSNIYDVIKRINDVIKLNINDQNRLSIDELQYYYKIAKSNMKNAVMVEFIRNQLEDLGRIYNI